MFKIIISNPRWYVFYVSEYRYRSNAEQKYFGANAELATKLLHVRPTPQEERIPMKYECYKKNPQFVCTFSMAGQSGYRPNSKRHAFSCRKIFVT